MQLESACPDYVRSMSTAIEGGMGFVFSSWDNPTGEFADFEPSQCTAATSCDNSVVTFSNITILQMYSNEDPPQEQTTNDPPAPEPATWETLTGYSNQSGYSPSFTMHVKGLDGKTLSTQASEVSMGLDNRAFFLESQDESDVMWAYYHDLLGGSLSFTVDASALGCGCAAGIHAVTLDNAECSWDSIISTGAPKCPSIEIMKANSFGFQTAAHPCPLGTCDATSQCMANARDQSSWDFGPN